MSFEPSAREFPADRAAAQDIEELLVSLAARWPRRTCWPTRFMNRCCKGRAPVWRRSGAIWIRERIRARLVRDMQLNLGALVLAENWADAQRHTQLLSVWMC